MLTGRPTLPELLRFTRADNTFINITEEIGDEYQCFGILLLQDETGAKIKNIEHQHPDPTKINTEIFRNWLAGKGKQPMTWDTLVQVLHDSKLSTLAEDISTVKCPLSE